MKSIRTVVAAGVAACALYGAYVYGGYRYLTSQYELILLGYSLYPDGLPARWRLLPYPSTLAREALFSKPPEEVRREVAVLGLTLYSAGVGFVDVHSRAHRDLTAAQLQLLQETSKFLFRSGVGLDLGWVDDGGCTAIHQALIMRDESGVRFLMALGQVDRDLANPKARIRACASPVETLAQERGVSWN